MTTEPKTSSSAGDELANAVVGDYITFGAYEQDNDTSNGIEPIEWLVLAKENGRLLVVSRYALDSQPYHATSSDVTWETCTLRTWLNKDFYITAFKSTEQARIPSVIIVTDKVDPSGTADPGKSAVDKVFLLSGTEFQRYFTSDVSGDCQLTAYAKAQGAYSTNNDKGYWWLRSPGLRSQRKAAYVDGEGSLVESGISVRYDKYVIRPAMWIELDP